MYKYIFLYRYSQRTPGSNSGADGIVGAASPADSYDRGTGRRPPAAGGWRRHVTGAANSRANTPDTPGTRYLHILYKGYPVILARSSGICRPIRQGIWTHPVSVL